ncbi:DNA-binding transcriptional LysR family regulator [Branchiibius hedensis]|uniref:DNA-binding transcriptional regulator, LysR family n=1 Tax=Branchiibius hedensis TaxID=672460 RepID=A0A2Y9A187_9MICO|nr:LysR family transcriptional regulator [Branchiibius hedensis]PWJ27126.1 DNA-binding transcriptional LysR family regulator [Branchiibius hedensis]SSA35937.1 DNA-binding transcriptional regulator, LysR family [Branchiibius hedensis]
MIDVHRLRVFRAVVASGSVQAAATNLGYTPSAISQHLTALQKETGLALFAKDGRGIAPTPAGRVLAEQSDAVMAQLSRLNGVVDDLREGRTETLTIASFASAGQVWMPQVARGLRDEFPDLQLTVNLNELPGSPAPDGAQLDLRTEDPAGPPTSMPGYTRTLLCEEDYVVAVAMDHPLAQRDSTPLADLAVERWISDTSGADICARILRGATQAAGFTPRYAAVTSDHHSSLAFAAAGIGVAVLPLLTVATPPPDVAIVRISDAPRRRIVAFVLDDATTSAAVQRAIALLRTVSAGD